MSRMIIIRIKDDGVQTLGIGLVVDKQELIYAFRTLELPWRENQRRISCIPGGMYTAIYRYTDRFRGHFHILDVENRTKILIHAGNFTGQTEGCLLPGEKFIDINKDGTLDIAASRKTLNHLGIIMPKRFTVQIVNA